MAGLGKDWPSGFKALCEGCGVRQMFYTSAIPLLCPDCVKNNPDKRRIAELEAERDIFKRTLDKRDKQVAELEAALRIISDDGCEGGSADYDGRPMSCIESWPDGADEWCIQCVATNALTSTGGDE